MTYAQQMAMARKAAKEGGEYEIKEKATKYQDDSDLMKCMNVRKTHISHLSSEYVTKTLKIKY